MAHRDRTSFIEVRSSNLFFCLFVCLLAKIFAKGYRPEFLSYHNESLHTHCPEGDIGTFHKNLGGGPPWGKFFSQIFLRDIDLKICMSHGPDPGNNMQKKFLAPDPPGLRGLASKMLELAHARGSVLRRLISRRRT